MKDKTYRNPSITKYDFTEEDLRSLYTIVNYGACHASEKAEAIWYFNNRISYGRLIRDIDAFAAGLAQMGIKKGDFVTIFLPNIP